MRVFNMPACSWWPNSSLGGTMARRPLRILGTVVGVQGFLLLLTGWGSEGQGWLVFLGFVLLIIGIDLLYKGGAEFRRHSKRYVRTHIR